MTENDFKPLLDETQDFYCWRLYKKGYSETSIKRALKENSFIDKTSTETPDDVYNRFLKNRIDYIQKLEENRPTRTRYAFVKVLSKHFGITSSQAEFWVQFYEKFYRTQGTNWPN